MLKTKKLLKYFSLIFIAALVALSICFFESNAAYAEGEEDYPVLDDETSEDTESPYEDTEPPYEETEPPYEETDAPVEPTTTEDTEDTEDTEPPEITTEEETEAPPPPPPEMQLDFYRTTLELGKGVQLNASLINSPDPNAQIGFTSSNTAVARVDTSGYIVSTGLGETVITAYWGDTSASAVITVIPAPVIPEYIVVNKTEFELKIGASAQIEAKLLPEEISEDYEMTYSSDNPSCVAVSASGLITAVKSGSAVITVESAGISETVQVKVSEDIAYEHSKLDGYLYDTKGNPIAGERISIDAMNAVTDSKGYFIFPEAERRNLVMAISSDSAASCAINLTEDITVYLLYNKGSLTRVASYDELAGLLPISSVDFDSRFKNIVMNVGDIDSLTYQYLPKDAVITEIHYDSSNSLVAQIGQIDGVITAKSPGEAQITLSLNGGQAEAVCTITVNPVESSDKSVLILTIELIVIVAFAAIIIISYKKYKKRAESILDEEDEDEADIHDIE